MKRSDFICTSAAVLAAAGLPREVRSAADPFDPIPGAWRTYVVTTSVTLAPGDAAQAWIPVPSFTQPSWMRPGESSWSGDASDVALARDARWNTQMVHAQWPARSQSRTLTVVSGVSTRNLDVAQERDPRPVTLTGAQRSLYLAPTAFIPTDGIVKSTADKITAGATSDREKLHRIYRWVVANTYRKPTTRGCGLGNVAFMLETGDLGGKCADLNSLAVGLARASGIPARDIFGIRVAPSQFGYHSLGANSPTITKAQHCRAEAYLSDVGWFPLDPADVRKVILEEPPGNLPMTNPKVADADETLFGAWEGNYMAYNDAHDVPLPGFDGKPVPFLMYPQAEIGGERLDSLDPATFAYTITAKRVA